MMVETLSLESFEDAFADDVSSSDVYKLGYKDGRDAAAVETAADQTALSDAFVQSLNTIDFTYAEARGQLLGSLAPLLSTIVEKILPHCVATGFVDQLADILMETAARDAAAAITLHIHPSQRQAFEFASKSISSKIKIQDDANLGEHAAWIGNNRSETHLDVDALLAEISDVLSAIQHPENRTETHG